jgi:hypothetical protein
MVGGGGKMETERLYVLRLGGQHLAVLLSSKFYRIYSLRPCLHILLMFLFCTQTANSSLQTGTNPLRALFPSYAIPPSSCNLPSPCTVCYLASDCNGFNPTALHLLTSRCFTPHRLASLHAVAHPLLANTKLQQAMSINS